MNSIDGHGSINQRFIPDYILTDVNDNMSNTSMDDSPKKENNGINYENNASTADEHNITESNINVPIYVLNGMSLPSNCDPELPEIISETEDNEVQIVNHRGALAEIICHRAVKPNLIELEKILNPKL